MTLQGEATPSVNEIPSLDYEWTQTGGTTVTFIDSTSGTAPNPNFPFVTLITFPAVTFTAPSTADTLEFTLTVTQPGDVTSVGTDTVIITVVAAPTPEEALAALSDDVQALVDGGILNGGQGNALTTKLDAALAKLADGKGQTAINKLQAFINQVQDYFNSGVLTLEEAQPLYQAAMAIIEQLNS